MTIAVEVDDLTVRYGRIIAVNGLSLTAGFYALVSRMLDAMRVELDDDIRDYGPKLP